MKKLLSILLLLIPALKSCALDIDHERRIEILNICEVLNSAYNAKDLTYIEEFFKRVLYLEQNNSEKMESGNPQKLIQYLKSLWHDKGCSFKTSEITIKQSLSNADFYSVSFRQDWNSEHYSYNGYVTLIIGFGDSQTPIVHVFVWSTGDKLDIRKLPTVSDFNIG